MKRSAVLVALLVAVVVGAGAPAGPVGAARQVLAGTVCGGSLARPGTVAGGVTYAHLEVSGVCELSSGPVAVAGDVVVDPGASLVGAYGLDSRTGLPAAGLTVIGSVLAGAGATLVLGCDAVHLPCLDEPNPGAPTHYSTTTVHGSVVATDPLGVVLHHSSVDGDLLASGGGGGATCAPDLSSVFTLLPNFGAVYSDYEDVTVGGDLRVTGLASCWLGALRLAVHGSATFAHSTFADPDADEVLNDTVGGNLLCTDLSPAVHFGDAGQAGSTVGGYGTGDCAFARRIPYPNTQPVMYAPVATPATGPPGYWLAADDGGIFSFGVPYLGSAVGSAAPVTAFAASPGGIGYQASRASGGPVLGFGAHPACAGSTPPLNRPIVGMAAAPGGGGCWLVAADGGVFSLGSGAGYFGSTGAIALNQPIVGMAPAPDGDGYYLVASDGGVFAFGPGTTFQGSMGGRHLNRPIVGMAVDPSTGGYWLVASDGGIFSFGAPFLGSMGAVPLNRPIVGTAAAPDGVGYYLVASDGGIFAFGSAVFRGSTGAIALNRPIIGMALG